jgi:hypothetical protein
MQSEALAMPSKRPHKAFWVWAGLAGLAAVVVAAEVAAYSWRASVDARQRCGLGCPSVSYRDRAWWVFMHLISTRAYDILVMAARQCVVIALALVGAVFVAPVVTAYLARRRQSSDKAPGALRRGIGVLAIGLPGLALVGVAAGLISALLQHPIPNDGASFEVAGLSVGWPWYLSNNVLLAAEAMLALAFAVGVAVWRQQSSHGHAG